jgi:hypothetical protein
MAELEAGLTTLSGLRGESDGAADADEAAGDFDETHQPPKWRIEVASGRSEFTNLSLVELTVIENISPQAEAAGENPMRYVLRQLVALRENEGGEFEEDPLMRGLPREEASR